VSREVESKVEQRVERYERRGRERERMEENFYETREDLVDFVFGFLFFFLGFPLGCLLRFTILSCAFRFLFLRGRCRGERKWFFVNIITFLFIVLAFFFAFTLFLFPFFLLLCDINDRTVIFLLFFVFLCFFLRLFFFGFRIIWLCFLFLISRCCWCHFFPLLRSSRLRFLLLCDNIPWSEILFFCLPFCCCCCRRCCCCWVCRCHAWAAVRIEVLVFV